MGMNTYPVFKIDACLSKDLPLNNKVVSYDDIEYFLWIHIPEELSRTSEVYDMDVVQGPEVDNLFAELHHESGPWYKIRSDVLDIESPGQRVYRLRLVNRYTNDTTSLFINYILQNSKPDKPYVYMDEKNCGCRRIKWIDTQLPVDYNSLTNKPKINGITLSNDKTSKQLKLQDPVDLITYSDIDDITEDKI